MDQIVDLDEAKQAAKDAYDYIWENAKAYGRDAKVYLHWTAGYYDTVFDDYNFCITKDGTIHYTCPLTEPVSSTYMRNSGSVSIALCAAVGATCEVDDNGNWSWDLGECPPTEEQIYAMSALVDVICDALDLTIDNDRVMTHGEAADNEDGLNPGYEPYAVWSDPQPSDGETRWDLAVLSNDDEWRSGGDTIRGNAVYIREHPSE